MRGREGEREAERHIEMITLCHKGPKLFPVQCGLEENKSSELVLFISSLIISVFQCAIIIVLLETRDFLGNTVKKCLGETRIQKYSTSLEHLQCLNKQNDTQLYLALSKKTFTYKL